VTAPDYQFLFRHLPDSYILLLPDGTVVDHTASAEVGALLLPQEPRAPHVLAAYCADPASLAALRASQEYVRQHKQPHAMPVTRCTPPATQGGTTESYCQLTHYPLLDEAGELRYILLRPTNVSPERLPSRASEAVEDQFGHLIETLPLITFVLNVREQAFQYLSPQWFEFTGQALATAELNSCWQQAVHPHDQPQSAAAVLQAIETRRRYSQELRLRRHDGKYCWFLLRAEPVRTAEGSLLRWIGSITEINEQKQLQGRLETKDTELQRILHHLPIYLNTTEGPQHRFGYLSPGIDQMLHGRAHVGQSVAHCLPEMVDQGFVHLLDGVYYTGEPFSAIEQPLTLLNATGQLERRYFNFGCQLLPPFEGREATRGVLCSWLDVTETVRARQRADLLKAEVAGADARLRRLTESLPVITFITDAAGRTTYISPQWYAYTGLPAGGPWAEVDTAWPDVVHPDDRQTTAREIQLSITEGRLGRIEVRLRGADGQYRWHVTEAVPELDANGRLLQRYGYMLDVHELREAQRQLELQSEPL
jgi:PAS domain S-box-containing protein